MQDFLEKFSKKKYGGNLESEQFSMALLKVIVNESLEEFLKDSLENFFMEII